MAVSPFPVPVVGSPSCCEGERCCTTRRRNAHGTDIREVIYQWHPWRGRQIHVHQAVERAGGIVFRCNLTGTTSDRLLEIPAWMFDRAVCTMTCLEAASRVDIGALSALSRLLQVAAKKISASSVSSAAFSPHDSYSGGLDGTQADDSAARSVLQPQRFRDRAASAMADPAAADTPSVDAADRTPATRAYRQRSRRGTTGDVR